MVYKNIFFPRETFQNIDYIIPSCWRVFLKPGTKKILYAHQA